jgi:polysaccharide export outer membrane protein
MNPEAAILFNPNLGEGSSYTAENAQHRGYLVDDKGNIDLPLIGLMQVSGLTTSELRENLKKALLKYYNDPVVNVRIANITVAVYGDVEKPNVYPLQNERTTITQAISMAGDLNITGMRTNVFDSPYYYLRNNDEIYVQPDKTKFATVDRGYHTATLTLSGLSIIAIVLSNILLYKR